MKFAGWRCWGGCLAGLLACGLAAQTPTRHPDRRTEPVSTHVGAASPEVGPETGTGLFYATPGDSSANSFLSHADRIGVIAPQSYSLDRWGRLHGSLPSRLAATARAHGVPIEPLVINAGFSRINAERLLHDPAARDHAIGGLLEEAREQHLRGWQIDFENLPSTQRAAFSEFVREAALAMHRHGFELSVAVAARTSDNPNTDTWRTFSGVYDYAALARSADFLSVMAYPESDAQHPGPLAGYPWVEQVIQHVLVSIPPDKLSLGLPTYQTDWMERRVRVTIRRRIGRRVRRIVRYIYRLFFHDGPVTVNTEDLRWDPVLKSSYRITGSPRHRRIIWVEDERSFVAKLQLVSQYHLRGYSVWRLGLEDPHIWGRLPVLDRRLDTPARAREASDDPKRPLPESAPLLRLAPRSPSLPPISQP